MIKEDRLLEKYNEIRDKVGNTIKNGSGWKPEYNEKYFKTKTKSYERRFNKNFQNDKMPKKYSHYICLSVVLIESVFKMIKNRYS